LDANTESADSQVDSVFGVEYRLIPFSIPPAAEAADRPIASSRPNYGSSQTWTGLFFFSSA